MVKFKNVVLIVRDVERAKEFYRYLFGLQPIADFGTNVMLTEGFCLQEQGAWERICGRSLQDGESRQILYFEDEDLALFAKKLEHYMKNPRYLHPLQEAEDGRRVLRFYDEDGHLLEVRESSSLKKSARRLVFPSSDKKG